VELATITPVMLGSASTSSSRSQLRPDGRRDRLRVRSWVDDIGQVEPRVTRGVAQMDRPHPADADLSNSVHGDSLAARVGIHIPDRVAMNAGGRGVGRDG
jgi:hypothetical protein